MITKADIKQETNSVSYNRGKKIYEEQKVHAFQVQEMEDIFGYSSASGRKRPTNSEYVACIADKVRLDYEGNILVS